MSYSASSAFTATPSAPYSVTVVDFTQHALLTPWKRLTFMVASKDVIMRCAVFCAVILGMKAV
jgi:hypothetical protein